MEELARLEAQRGNPEYLEMEKGSGDGTLKNKDIRHGTAGQAGGHKKAAGEGFGQQESAGRGRRASNEMCIFLILNISSLQLIPVNMIAYRSQYGSANPAVIIVPAIVATLVSTLVAIVYCKIKDRGGKAI